MRWELLSGLRPGQSVDHARNQRHDQTDRAHHADEKPRQDFRARATSQAKCDAHTILEHRELRSADALARAVVALIPNVEDGALCHTASCSKSSVSARRRGAIRRNAACVSTTASRTWS